MVARQQRRQKWSGEGTSKKERETNGRREEGEDSKGAQKQATPSTDRQAVSPDKLITRADTTTAPPRSSLNPNREPLEFLGPFTRLAPLSPCPFGPSLFLPTGLPCLFVP